jgi:uncharacterized coiled-coil protein SlyX
VVDGSKTPAERVDEISKLVQDAQDTLDQVGRALRTLKNELREVDSDPPRS